MQCGSRTAEPHAHLIGAGTSGAASHLRQIIRPEERVPKRFRGAVSVEDLRSQNLLIADAVRTVQRTPHGDDAVQAVQISGVLLLFLRQQLQHVGNADEERQTVLLHSIQRLRRLKLPLDDHRSAGVQRGSDPAGVQTATVKPRRGIHGHIGKGKGEVHHHIVCRQHLVDAGEADALLLACCAGGEQTQRFVIGGQLPRHCRLFCGILRSKGGIGGAAACRRSRQHQLRCVGSMSQASSTSVCSSGSMR